MEEQYPGFNSLQGYVMPDDPDNASIRWGTAFEDSIVKLAEEKAGIEIINRERLYSLSLKYVTCHIDGTYALKKIEDYSILHEGKTTSYWQWNNTWGEPGTDRVPAYIQCQVQHQLLCAGAEKCIVSVLVFSKRPDEWEKEGKSIIKSPHKDDIGKYIIKTEEKYMYPTEWANILSQMGYFHQYPITADKALHAIMVEKYKEWWQFHIIEKQPPDPENTDDIKRLFPEPIGTIVANQGIEMLCSEYKQIGKEISKTGRLGKRRESIKVQILDWMRKQDSVIDEDTREKTILRDRTGKKLASWNGKAFK